MWIASGLRTIHSERTQRLPQMDFGGSAAGHIHEYGVYSANHDARAALTDLECGVHRLN